MFHKASTGTVGTRAQWHYQYALDKARHGRRKLQKSSPLPRIAKPAVYKAHGVHPLGVARVCGDAFRRSVQSWLDGSGRVLLVLLVRMVLVQRADGVKTGSALPPSPLALPLDRDPPEGCVAYLPLRAFWGPVAP